MTLSPTSSHGVTFNGGTITAPLTVDNSSGSAVALLVRGDGSHDAVELYTDHSGSYLILDANTRMELYNGTALGSSRFFLDDNNGGLVVLDSWMGVTVQPAATDATAANLRVGAGTAAVGLVVDGQGFAGQFRLDTNARPVIATTTAPADASLSAGDCALWFDSTNGTAALNIKAKQADGTVKTATIPVIT